MALGQPSQGMMLHAVAQRRLGAKDDGHCHQAQTKYSERVVTDEKQALANILHHDRRGGHQRAERKVVALGVGHAVSGCGLTLKRAIL